MVRYTGKVTAELREIYQRAGAEGIWIREWVAGTGKYQYMAGAGSIENITKLEKKLGKEIDIMQLELGDIVNLSLPGTGRTREEACQNAIDALKKYQRTKSR